MPKILLPGTIFIKFKRTGMDMKYKFTPYKESKEDQLKAGQQSAEDKFHKSYLNNNSVVVKEGRSLCFIAHHMGSLLTGLRNHCATWNFKLPDGAYVFYDYRETKNTVHAKSAMQRGGLVAFTGLAREIEKATQHQHMFYVTTVDITRAHGGFIGEDTAKKVTSYPRGTSINGKALFNRINFYAQRMVVPTPSFGGLASEGAQDAVSVAVDIIGHAI